MSRIIIIGGGAAGMMAACRAAELGAEVILLEKNEKLGKKVYITGKGRCNVTNLCDEESFLNHVVRNARFLYSAYNSLPPKKLMSWFEERGCPLVVERGNRVFPQSQKASDITRSFEREMKRLRVDIRLGERVTEISTEGSQIKGVQTQNIFLEADAVILATGGCSYPSTGSDGDGWKWLSALGHKVYPPCPSLTGIRSDAEWVRALQGLSLKNVQLTLRRQKKVLYAEQGEMLFTHFGVSGPLVLSASAFLTGAEPNGIRLLLDLKPALSIEQLDARILRDIAQMPLRQTTHLLRGLYPQHLADVICSLCGLNPDGKCGMLTREDRLRLVQCTKELEIPVSGLCGLQEAIVTRGGVDVREINPSNMQSKKIEGLYVAGELLDVDALTGGFNLQIAFSTGYVAAQSAAISKRMDLGY